jgi:hypothetical protein
MEPSHIGLKEEPEVCCTHWHAAMPDSESDLTSEMSQAE